MPARSFTTAAFAAAVACAGGLTITVAAAQDIAAGKRKAIACQACHGLDGIATRPDAPNIAAQPSTYLERELRAYRSGSRRNEVMAVAAKALGDADIRDLAAYYSAIQIEVKALPQ